MAPGRPIVCDPDTGHWGLSHNCKHCGASVQYYDGPRVPRPTLFDGGTWKRHSCPNLPIPETVLMIECFCGMPVWKYEDGGKLNRPEGTPHICHMVLPAPARKPDRLTFKNARMPIHLTAPPTRQVQLLELEPAFDGQAAKLQNE